MRALPSEGIGMIDTAENDYRQEIFYRRDAMDENPWPAYDQAWSNRLSCCTSRSIERSGHRSERVTWPRCCIGSALSPMAGRSSQVELLPPDVFVSS